MPAIHLRNLRYRVNAGMDYAHCQAIRALIHRAPDSHRWPTTGELSEVTCKNCLRNLDKSGRGHRNR